MFQTTNLENESYTKPTPDMLAQVYVKKGQVVDCK